MRYLSHIEKSISRLGYVKPEYAPTLAIIMEEHEGQHPHQIARLFRQHGQPLPAEIKRQLGIRTNTDMTAEAVDALTQRGLSEPIKGLEYTLLDASFGYFRERSVTQARDAGYDRFKISGMFAGECVGCARMNGQIATGDILADLPPHDCERQACGLGLTLNIDFIQELVDREAAKHIKKRSFFARLFGR